MDDSYILSMSPVWIAAQFQGCGIYFQVLTLRLPQGCLLKNDLLNPHTPTQTPNMRAEGCIPNEHSHK